MNALLERETLDLALNADGFEAEGRTEAELSYGFAVFQGQSTLAPYVGMTFSETGADWRLGSRLRLNADMDLTLEVTRKERPSEAPDHGVEFSIETIW